jgi:hypothetical protein
MEETAVDVEIPDSELPRPKDWWGRSKYRIWKAVYPHYEDIRDTLLKLGVIWPRNSGRQPHLIGTLAPNKKIGGFLKHLESQGFGNNFVAWEDSDELAGLRRPDGFHYQYHLRIFKDGEVRGHYEFTPEAHPIRHLGYRHMKDRRDDFLFFCGDWIIPAERPEES